MTPQAYARTITETTGQNATLIDGFALRPLASGLKWTAANEPVLAEMDDTAAQRDGCSASWSSTIRIAR